METDGVCDENAMDTNDSSLNAEEDRADGQIIHEIKNVRSLRDRNPSQELSNPIVARCLPWRILVQFRSENEPPTLGIFLQCSFDGDIPGWTCRASAEIKLVNQKSAAESSCKRIEHTFCSKENDWGYVTFMPWKDVTDESRGFMRNGTIIVEAKLRADPPHGVCWDSKKYTGFIGLKNQGATCYMNSLLQTLYFTNKVRKAVYEMPTENDDTTKSVPLAMQRVFYDLQYSDKPVGTRRLTKSFGWESFDSFMQHDVQELSRVLLDKMEEKMKGTCVEGTIPKLFEGETEMYIKCKNVDFESSKTETFYDIQLKVKNKRNVYESFDEYVEAEMLEGDNKYDAGKHGMQEAEKGVIFTKFPPVLHLQLMRFTYDYASDANVKINDRYEFPEQLQLDKYLKKRDARDPAVYQLHAVLVHSGDIHGGHYVAYIDPLGTGKWCKFDDDVVCRSNRPEAIEENFGGSVDDLVSRSCTSAYMLVYIRTTQLENVLCSVEDSDIPDTLRDRLLEEKRIESIRRKEKQEADQFITVMIFFEDTFNGHQGPELFDRQNFDHQLMKVRRTHTFTQVYQQLSEQLGYPLKHIRLWYVNETASGFVFKHVGPVQYKESLEFLLKRDHQPMFWVELLAADSGYGRKELPAYERSLHSLVFFRFYDAPMRKMAYCGHRVVAHQTTVSTLLKELRLAAGLSPDTKLLLFYEVKGGLKPIDISRSECSISLMRELPSLVLYFQVDPVMLAGTRENLPLPTATAYFDDYADRIVVEFMPKTLPGSSGLSLFKLEGSTGVGETPNESVVLSLNQNTPYGQVVQLLAREIKVDGKFIQMYRVGSRELPSEPIPPSFDGRFGHILPQTNVLRYPTVTPRSFKVYYSVLDIPVEELETRSRFPIQYVPASRKLEPVDLVVYPPRDGNVNDLLECCRALILRLIQKASQNSSSATGHSPASGEGSPPSNANSPASTTSPARSNGVLPESLSLSLPSEGGSLQMRLLSVTNCNIDCTFPPDFPLSQLQLAPFNFSVATALRVDEVPTDQLTNNMRDRDLLVPVGHFWKELSEMHGLPFIIRYSLDDTYADLLSRIKNYLGVSDKEFSTWKAYHCVNQQRRGFPEDLRHPLDLKFMPKHIKYTMKSMSRAWIGLEHKGKVSKRSKFGTQEKAIKILN